MEIMVSVCCLVYNHEKYLRKTLEGFVNQKVNFAYEVIIHDDASTDSSAAIIREYCEKYPGLFRPILQTENQYSKRRQLSRTFIYPLVTGKYVAMCEGDDYWCDENKLQLQVDYMETHPDCSMCVHDTAMIDGDGNYTGMCVNGSRKDRDYSPSAAIRADGGGICQTSSFFARRHVITERPVLYNVRNIGDLPIVLHAAFCGYIHYIGKVMSCYRVGHTGAWSTINEQHTEKLVQQKLLEYEDFTRIDEETAYRYTRAFAVIRGLRLSILYRKKYGIAKLLKKPSHLFMVIRTHCHTFPRRMYKKFLSHKNRGEHIPL